MTTKQKGVMIKGMDMPEKCFSCPCRYVEYRYFGDIKEVGCRIRKKKINIEKSFDKRPSWCPLQEVK